MSEKEDETRPITTSHNIEDIDIYSDILSDRPESVLKLRQAIEKLTSEKTLLLKSLNALQESYEQMLKKFKEIDVKYKTICYNSSSLFKTAKCEIARKDRMIQELRRERDNLVFRKTPTVQVLGRARKILRTPNKSRSPFKKTEPDENVSLQKTSFAEDYDEEEENNLLSLGTKKSGEDKSDDIECNVAGKHDKNDGLISTSAKTNFNTPPPLHGPLTEYTKRMYKKSYGVSPPKSPSVTDHSCKIKENTISDISKAGSSLSTEIVEVGNSGNSPEQDVVASKVTSKLQDQVKEFIKLGSKPTTHTAKSTLSPTTKSPKNQNNKMLDLGSNEVLKESQPTLILQCDLRTPKNIDENRKLFVNTVSVNETIDNIIKNQKAGLYNRKQLIESKGARTDATIPLEIISLASISTKNTKLIPSDNFNNFKNIRGTTRPNRLVAGLNKRVTSNKPAISPVTFGNLVVPDTCIPGRSAPPAVSSDIVHCREESRKNRVLTALFGESPMKPNLNRDESPSPTAQSDCQILPSSPSVDSDNPEDLVIDTTVGSHNTSPRVSESSNKDEGERIEVLKPELPETCTNNGPEEQSLNERGVIACSNVEGEINMERLDCGHDEATENSSGKNKTLLHSGNNELENLNQRLLESDEVAKRGESCLPDLSECLSLDNVNQLSANFKEKHSAVGNISQHISCNPERKTISEELHIKPTNVFPRKQNAQMNRFIPSPPQLTLVSAFKHSENSVFSIAEDTMGFVSALTRIRDISPLRTPSKKRKNTSTETHQSQGQDSDQMCESELGIEVKQFKSSIKPNDVGSNEKNTHENSPITFQTAKENEGKSYESVEKGRKPLKSITNPNLDPFERSKLENSNKNEPESGSCSRENVGVFQESVFDKTKKSPFSSEFKRARPVRRIIPILNKPEIISKITKESVCIKSIETKTSIVAKVQCPGESRKPTTVGLENVVNSTVDLQPNEPTLGTADELDVKQDNKISIGNTRKPNRKCVEELKPTIKNHNLNVSDISKPHINTNKIQTTQQSPNNFKNLIYKRSESLKMMPKPVAKVNYDILSNNKIEISKKIIPKSAKITTQETEKKELEQIPHIASINKRIRISNYQGNVEKTKPQESTYKALEVLQTSKVTINKECEAKDQIVLPPASDQQIAATELHSKQRRSTGLKIELVQRSKGILQESPNNLSEPLKINKDTKENLDETFLNSKKVLQSNCPKKTQRRESSHCVKRSQSRSPDPTKSIFHSNKTHSRSPDSNKTAHCTRKSQSRSPDASCRPTSHHRSRRSFKESTGPSFRTKSQHRLRRSPSLSPEGIHPKSMHRSRRSRSRSPHLGNRTKSHNRSRRSHSRSPGYYCRNKFDHRPRRSQSRSPDYSRLTTSYLLRRDNSRSPESYDVRKPMLPFRSRSPYKILSHRNHIKRLRSRSPSPNESRINSVHYYSRRSNDSPHRSRRKVERIQSPPYAKRSSFNNRKYETSKHADINDQNQSSPVQDSPEEIAMLRKELELMRSKLKESELAANNSPTGQEKPSNKNSSLHISVDKNLDSPNDKLQIVKEIRLDCTRSEEQADFINETNETSVRIASEECKRSSSASIKEMVTSSLQTDNGEGEGEPNKQSGQEVIKVIKLTRRRVGHLGDSDVNVVSSTSKFSSRTKAVTP